MPTPIISVENLSKSYQLGHQVQTHAERGHATFRDAIVRNLHSTVRKAGDVLRGRQVIQGDEVEEFWALRDISFEVQQGEVLGIIGRNGAGKSTLLKILSRITEPTQGRVTLRGRVASLLEVGTGFHPELSGRENIYLNGAILGMTQAEVRRKFDEIVDFSGVERFLDTPVKRYSSGMYVRLAFAVAAHLDPEILIVDEVLAVGDAEFQRKCLGKMNDVAHRQGRTVIVVSHNMGVIMNLSSRAIWLEKGELREVGEPQALVGRYLAKSSRNQKDSAPLSEEPRPPWIRDKRLRIRAFKWLSDVPLRHGEPARARISFSTSASIPDVVGAVGFGVLEKVRILTYQMDFGSGYRRDLRSPGDYTVELAIDSLPLGPDTYDLSVSFRSGDFYHLDFVQCPQIEVTAGSDSPANLGNSAPGVRLEAHWEWDLDQAGDKIRASP